MPNSWVHEENEIEESVGVFFISVPNQFCYIFFNFITINLLSLLNNSSFFVHLDTSFLRWCSQHFLYYLHKQVRVVSLKGNFSSFKVLLFKSELFQQNFLFLLELPLF